jgi:hypothetical protein
MFGSTILDAAIGLVFIYLLVSLVISAANEIIAGFSSPAQRISGKEFSSFFKTSQKMVWWQSFTSIP